MSSGLHVQSCKPDINQKVFAALSWNQGKAKGCALLTLFWQDLMVYQAMYSPCTQVPLWEAVAAPTSRQRWKYSLEAPPCPSPVLGAWPIGLWDTKGYRQLWFWGLHTAVGLAERALQPFLIRLSALVLSCVPEWLHAQGQMAQEGGQAGL